MLYGGSAGPAKAQMKAALHFSLDDDRQHLALNWQDLELAERNLDAIDLPDEKRAPVILETGNGVWITQALGDVVESAYLDLLGVNYGTGVYLADFSTDQAAEAERQAINAWISQRTNELIPELLPIGMLDKDTASVLANALYFTAPWTAPFDEEMTSKRAFTLQNGSTVAVDMMSHSALEARYGDGPGYAALAIPLRGIALEVVFVVPEGALGEFEADLDQPGLATLLDELRWEHIDTHVPRFELSAQLNLTPVFAEQLGMSAPFIDPEAFTGIVPDGLGVLTDVVHDTVLEVDERGVEAAAATGLVIVTTGRVEPSHEFWVDKPFIVMIHDRPTRSVLFLGRVLDPSGGLSDYR
jgi:serpin B